MLGSGYQGSTRRATGLMSVAGMRKPGNGWRPVPPPPPVYGLYSRKLGYAAATSEKSPARIFSEGTPQDSWRPLRPRYRSHEAKKKSRSRRIGPPRVPPKMLRESGGFARPKASLK